MLSCLSWFPFAHMLCKCYSSRVCRLGYACLFPPSPVGSGLGHQALATHPVPRVPHPGLPRQHHQPLRQGRAAVAAAPAGAPAQRQAGYQCGLHWVPQCGQELSHQRAAHKEGEGVVEPAECTCSTLVFQTFGLGLVCWLLLHDFQVTLTPLPDTQVWDLLLWLSDAVLLCLPPPKHRFARLPLSLVRPRYGSTSPS